MLCSASSRTLTCETLQKRVQRSTWIQSGQTSCRVPWNSFLILILILTVFFKRSSLIIEAAITPYPREDSLESFLKLIFYKERLEIKLHRAEFCERAISKYFRLRLFLCKVLDDVIQELASLASNHSINAAIAIRTSRHILLHAIRILSQKLAPRKYSPKLLIKCDVNQAPTVVSSDSRN